MERKHKGKCPRGYSAFLGLSQSYISSLVFTADVARRQQILHPAGNTESPNELPYISLCPAWKY
jgi:hypothetical protein